jgi:hypothetical protein
MKDSYKIFSSLYAWLQNLETPQVPVNKTMDTYRGILLRNEKGRAHARKINEYVWIPQIIC